MVRFPARFFVILSILASTAGALAGGGGGNLFNGLSLSVSKETAPPGGIAQMKVFLTEPKPISTGGGYVQFDAYDTILGISLAAESLDTSGVALVHGNRIALSIVSPLASFGTRLDYPILAIAGRVPPDMPVGTKFPLVIDPAALQLFDSTGALYPVEVKQGHLVVGTGVAIGDVSPGSATVPAGGIVTITGTNFVPDTNVKFSEGKISAIQYVSPTRIDITLGLPLRMHGVMVKASNPDGSRATYFSYQRTTPASVSNDSVMAFAVPLMPPVSSLAATITLPAPAAGMTYGVALQNIESSDTTAFVELEDGSGSTAITVPSNRFVVRELSELFGFAPAGAATIRVTATGPIQVLGIAADQTAGTALAIPAK